MNTPLKGNILIHFT